MFETVCRAIGSLLDSKWNVLKAQYHEGLQEIEIEQERIKAQKSILQASMKYCKTYFQRYGYIKILGMSKAMLLDTIYTTVKFLKTSDLSYFSTLDDLEESYHQNKRQQFKMVANEQRDGLNVANQEQYLMVLGGPGVGKSIFLRKLGLEALKGTLGHHLLPIFIDLKRFREQRNSLSEDIVQELRFLALRD